MSFDRAAFLDKLRDSYEYYYDVKTLDPDENSDVPLVISAEFHARDEGYVLTKQVKIWAAESNEYVFIFSAPSFDGDTACHCIDYALADGMARIKPHSEHRNSFIIAIFIADAFDFTVQKEICKRKFDKSYKMGFHGWSALKTAAVDIEKEMIATNRPGEDIGKFLKKLLRSEKV
ncbi:MAG: hypothetical protein EOM54_01070 [Clostridia bacterium]|nr:hypothetical protein [Clostridia bacterium]NCC67828.1 hypothetical protein [Clostridia bacterium]